MEIIKISPKNLNKIVKETGQTIKNRGVVVCPTDTVYGLICDAANKVAVNKVLKIKKRLSKKPLPVFVKNLKMAKRLAEINKAQEQFLKKIWPGKITVVLKAKTIKFPRGILSKDKKIGLRIPNYKFLNLLLEKVNCPLVATSANVSKKQPSTKIGEVLKQLEGQKYLPDLILDARNLKISVPSTVIDLISFKILREGQFPKRKIVKLLNNLILR